MKQEIEMTREVETTPQWLRLLQWMTEAQCYTRYE